MFLPFQATGLAQSNNGNYDAELPRPPLSQILETASPAPVSFLTPINLSEITNTGYMVLVNRELYLPYEPTGNALVAAWPTVPVSVVAGMYLHPSALAAIADMLASARTADVGSFFMTSGFRDFASQYTLYNSGMDRAFVLPPGHSEHHTGLAADIQATGISQWQLANSPQGRWLAANSYRYGLILRYPEGTEHITGVAFEPWHFRYVGRAHAYFIYNNNLVLEEYIELLQELGSITFEKNGVTYHILRQIPKDGIIYVPTGLEFTISSDNTGGYIVKAW